MNFLIIISQRLKRCISFVICLAKLLQSSYRWAIVLLAVPVLIASLDLFSSPVIAKVLRSFTYTNQQTGHSDKHTGSNHLHRLGTICSMERKRKHRSAVLSLAWSILICTYIGRKRFHRRERHIHNGMRYHCYYKHHELHIDRFRNNDRSLKKNQTSTRIILLPTDCSSYVLMRQRARSVFVHSCCIKPNSTVLSFGLSSSTFPHGFCCW